MRKMLFCLIILVLSALAIPAQANDVTLPSQSLPALGHPACAGVSREVPSTPECDALIASRPVPINLSRVPVDLGIISNVSIATYRNEEVTIYDGPNGNEVETITTGYEYVAPSYFDGEWVELAPGRWAQRSDVRFARASDFSGVFINGGLDMPFAWVLWRISPSQGPAGVTDRSVQYQRYQLVNIYATVNVSGWDWHLVGPGHWIMQKNLSIVQPFAPAEIGGNWVGVDLYEQNLVAYSGGAPVMATLVSSGVKNGLWNTNEGTFAVHSRVEAGTMNGAEGASDYYSLEFVPYAQYFDGLISLHGTYWHDSFGYPHSHGCVNLTVSDAKWLFQSWLGEGSTVYVYSSR